MSQCPIVEARGLRKEFPMPAGPVTALQDVDLRVEPGEYLAVRGPSGCGKSTLLHLLGLVEPPSAGRLEFDGREVSTLTERERTRLRLHGVGFVFQRFFLLPMLTARENVELPMGEAGHDRARRRRRVDELLAYVGLEARRHHLPSQLSGGEMQRVAVARAIANRPRLLLADEPTGELDERTGAQIAELLDQVHRDGMTLIVVTHDAGLAGHAARTLTMKDGRIL